MFQQSNLQIRSTPFFVKASTRPKFHSNRQHRLWKPYPFRNSGQISVENDHGNIESFRKCTLEGDDFGCEEGSLEVAAEVEVNGTEADETTELVDANSNTETQQQTFDFLPNASITDNELLRSRHFFRSKTGTSSMGSIQQLLRFNPGQCCDINEFRVRMAAAQQKIEDLCSLNLNNVKLKHENGQLREKLDFSDQRIFLLESSILERNERLKELLRENVFMRAQFKKMQNEFGVQAMNEVINGRGGGKARVENERCQ